jgi:hypothetical protein
MPTILDSLFVRLGFQTDAKALEGYAKNVDALKGKMEGLKHIAEAYIGIEGLKKVGEFVRSTIEGMADIQEFSERVDMSATSVAALGRVAAENGSSLEGMEGTISSLNETLARAALGFPRAEKMLGRFGLKAKDAHGDIKTFDQILGEVATKMEGASTGKRLAMASALGIDPKLIPLLKEGGENFTRLREQAMKAGAFKDSDYERARETEKLFNKADGAFLRLKQRLAIGLLPTVNELLRKFTAWVSDSKNIARIQGYIEGVVKVAKLLWENASKIASVFAIIYAHKYGMMFLDWGAKLMAAAKGFAAANVGAKLLSVGFAAIKGVLTGGLIAAIALVAEDLWVFYQGGTSVTGWLLNDFPYAVEVAEGAIALLSGSLIAMTTKSGAIGLIVVGFAAWGVAIKEIYDNWDLLVDEMERGMKRISDNPVFKFMSEWRKEAKIHSGELFDSGNRNQGKGFSLFPKAPVLGFSPAGGAGAAEGNAGGIPSDWMAPGAGVFADFDRKPQWRMDRPVSSTVEIDSHDQITFHVSGAQSPKASADEMERKLNAHAYKKQRDMIRGGQKGTKD